MNLEPFVADVREQLLTAAANGGEEARAAAERMTATIDSALHLALLEALSAAADEITLEMAPGSVQVRLRGRDPEFAVALPTDHPAPRLPTTAPLAQTAPDAEETGAARITLRLPEPLKLRVEEAAGREGLSVNAWLVRALSAATDVAGSQPTQPSAGDQSFTGWVH